MIRALLRGSTAAATRETYSLALLDREGLRPTNLTMPKLLDPAFFMDLERVGAKPTEAERGLVSVVMRLDGFGIRIGAHESSSNLTTYRGDGFRSSRAHQFFRGYCQRILASTDSNLQILVQTERDLELSQSVMEAIVAENPEWRERLRLEVPQTLPDFLTLLSRGSLTVASRFHALIFSLLLGRPVLGIYHPEHGHKIPGLLELFETPGLAIQGWHGNLEGTVLATGKLLARYDKVCEQLVARREALETETQVWLRGALGA